MLVSTVLASVIAWGSAAVLIALGVGAYFELTRRGFPFAPLVGAVLGLGGLMLGVGGADGTSVVIVRDGGSAALRVDQRLYFSATYRYSDGHSEVLARTGNTRAIIVNDTRVPMVIETVRYGSGLSSSRPLPPYTSQQIDHLLEHFGPNDPPPSTTTVVGGGYDTEKYWLRW